MPVPALPELATQAPCNWTIDTGCCATWAEYSADLKARATRYATLVLWAATGRRYGTCEVTVRPCGKSWSNELTGTWSLAGSDGDWTPYVASGVWRNCWGGCAGTCCCEPQCQVWLPGPVAEVLTVVVDGVAVADDTWRVDNRQWLVRTDLEECWPACGDMNVDSGVGLFEVLYLLGRTVPPALLDAAGTLACEFAKACTGGACRLPSRATTVARSGVTVTLVDVDQLLDDGLTGITEVDMVIRALNPFKRKSRPRLYSPDLDQVRIVTQP